MKWDGAIMVGRNETKRNDGRDETLQSKILERKTENENEKKREIEEEDTIGHWVV